MPLSEKSSSQLYLLNKLLLHADFLKNIWSLTWQLLALGAIYQEEKAVYAIQAKKRT